jgi:uncharacterized FAD-dependent dehydrogenase
MLRIHEIKRGVAEDMAVIPGRIIKKLNIKGLEISDFRLIKESVDARNKADIKMVYSVDFVPALSGKSLEETETFLLNRCKGVKLEKAPDMNYRSVSMGQEKPQHRPVIAGFGPCGMFAGLILSELGYEPVIIERGKAVGERVRDVDRFWKEGILDEESNVQFGEGGAGLFSDGKLTTQIKDERVRKVLEEFVEAGGAPDLLYKQKPHIGTDVLRRIVLSIRSKIIENGGEILFQSKLTDLLYDEGPQVKKLRGIIVNGDKRIDTEALILAVGHSARDTFRALAGQGVAMVQKPFSIGVRIEHPQTMVNRAQYGDAWESHQLGAADYKLSHHCENGRGVYTFCMCPGGYVIGAASHEGCVVTNGMSYRDRGSDNANSALLVDVRTEDFPDQSPLAGVEFQEKYEKLAFQAGGGNYNAPAQRLRDFMGYSEEAAVRQTAEPTYRPGVTWTDLSQCLPDFAIAAMREAIPMLGRKLKGFDAGDSVMTGVETRSSSPVRIPRNEQLMGSVEGLYPAGEGAGYAGGIMSAAVDGIRIAEEIVKKYRSFR